MAEPICPPLGTGSVDFSALHTALTAKKPKTQDELAEAVKAATALPETASEEAAAPAAEPAAEG